MKCLAAKAWSVAFSMLCVMISPVMTHGLGWYLLDTCHV